MMCAKFGIIVIANNDLEMGGRDLWIIYMRSLIGSTGHMSADNIFLKTVSIVSLSGLIVS